MDRSVTWIESRDAVGTTPAAGSPIAERPSLLNVPPTQADPRFPGADRDLLAAVLALTTAPIIYLDRDGRYVFATPAAAAARGLSVGEMLGRRPQELPSPVSVRLFEARRRQVVETGRPARGEIAFVYKGRMRHAQFTIVPDFGPDGAVAGTVVTSQDNTEPIEHEREAWRLEHEVERLTRVHSMLSRINEAIVRVRDRDALIAEACRIAVEVGGYVLAWIGFVAENGEIRPAVHAGDDSGYADDLVLTIDAADPRGQGPVGVALRSGAPAAVDVETFQNMVTREGALARGYRSVGVFPLSIAGRVVAALALYADRPAAFSPEELGLFSQLASDLSFAFDVIESERLRTEAEGRLEFSARRFREVFEGSPIAMWMYDVDTLEFLAVNEAAVRIYGYSRDEFLTMTLRDIRPPEDVPALVHDVAATFDGPRPVRSWRHITKDGRLRDVEVSAQDIAETSGRHARLAIVVDITERRQLEERLRQTARIEALGQLAGGIAHDFNNLLTAVNGYADILSTELAGDPRLESVLEIRRAGSRAAELTRQLLAFARRQRLATRPVDLNTVVSSVVPMLGRLVGERIGVRTTLEAAPVVVEADSGQLEQVLVNLAVNARDAMPDGGTLEIATERVADRSTFARGASGPGALVTIADSGTGMDADTVARAFEPFFTTKPQGQGTGLGLATAFGIVAQSHGDIWIESEPGRGTRVRILLPLVAGIAEPAVESAKAVPAATVRATLLLVEDDADVRSFAVRSLERAGYQVMVAASPKQALALAGGVDERIDALVTDLVMPGGSGRDLAERLLAVRPGLRVVIMSGYDDHPAESMPGGAVFLPKPFGPDQLAAAVREALSS